MPPTDAQLPLNRDSRAQEGIRWMQRQERGENPAARGVRGGIMADDMGRSSPSTPKQLLISY